MKVRYFEDTDTLLIEFRDALPKTPSGKIKRKELREGERRC